MQKIICALALVLSVPAFSTPESETPPADVQTSHAMASPDGGLPPELLGPQYKGAIHLARSHYSNVNVGVGGWDGNYLASVQYQILLLDHGALGFMPFFRSTMPNEESDESMIGGMLTGTYYAFGNRPYEGIVAHIGLGGALPFGEAFGEEEGTFRPALMVAVGWAWTTRMGLSGDFLVGTIRTLKPTFERAQLTSDQNPIAMVRIGYRI